MREKEHLFIHDKGMFLLMLAVFCMSFFVVIQVISLQSNQKQAEEQKKREHYRQEYAWEYTPLLHNDDRKTSYQISGLNLKEITMGNVVLITYITVGDAYYNAPMHLVLSEHEPLTEELSEGHYPDQEDIEQGKRYVVVGEYLLRFAKKNGDITELKIAGVVYQVTGVLKDVTANGTDDRLIIYSNGIANEIYAAIRTDSSFRLMYGSNYGKLEADKIEKWLWQVDEPQCVSSINQDVLDEIGDTAETLRFIEKYNTYILYILFLFCMGSCYAVSSVWIRRRQKEIVIRKALGSSNLSILGILCRDSWIMIMLALVVDMVMLAVQCLIIGQNRLNLTGLWHDIMYIVAAGLIVMFITVLQPFYVAVTISPAEGTRSL